MSALADGLSGRTVVVTGAGGGIARPLVSCLAEAGAELVLVDVDEGAVARLTKALPARVRTVVSDCADTAACRPVLAACDGPVWGIVHLAGVFRKVPLGAGWEDGYREAMRHNADNAIALVNALVPRMTNPDGGRVVLTSSLAFTRGAGEFAPYAMAKGALVGLVRSLARSLGPRAITVNALAPGIIETPMPQDLIAARGEALRAQIPLGRFGRADEVSAVITFLLSRHASYITGQCLAVDGGASNR